MQTDRAVRERKSLHFLFWWGDVNGVSSRISSLMLLLFLQSTQLVMGTHTHRRSPHQRDVHDVFEARRLGGGGKIGQDETLCREDKDVSEEESRERRCAHRHSFIKTRLEFFQLRLQLRNDVILLSDELSYARIHLLHIKSVPCLVCLTHCTQPGNFG